MTERLGTLVWSESAMRSLSAQAAPYARYQDRDTSTTGRVWGTAVHRSLEKALSIPARYGSGRAGLMSTMIPEERIGMNAESMENDNGQEHGSGAEERDSTEQESAQPHEGESFEDFARRINVTLVEAARIVQQRVEEMARLLEQANKPIGYRPNRTERRRGARRPNNIPFQRR